MNYAAGARHQIITRRPAQFRRSALCADARTENALLIVDVAARWGTKTWFLYQRAGGRRPAELR